jgi:beta-galactosidase
LQLFFTRRALDAVYQGDIMKSETFKATRLVEALALSIVLSTALVACGGGGGGGGGDGSGGISVAPLRNVIPMAKGWKFVQDDGLTDEQALAASGTNWATVNLPHTWNGADAATTAQSTPTTPDYKRGLGWYRLEFDSTATSGKTKWLQFDAASMVADVWLNGVKVGQHRGAFTAFRFDVTSAVKAGKNVLLVKTDNRSPANDASPTAIAPLGGDFNVAGGLYRTVSMIETAATAHIALDDLGSTGVFAKTTSLAGTQAKVNVLTKLKNASATDGNFTVSTSLVESDGKTLKQTASVRVALKAGQSAPVTQDLLVEQAHLWNGLSDPYLYKLVSELNDSTGAVVDRVVQQFGIREMRFDANQGFFLNGKSVPLHGVNIHQDELGKAWAITNEDVDRTFEFIKEVGANTVRMAHYPHSDYTVQKADQLGVVVWAELPLVNATSRVSLADPEATGFAANARQQLQELIRQKFNNASIGLWSIANEVTGGNDARNNVQPLLKSLNDVAKTEDPSRLTTLANQVTRNGDVVLPDSLTQTGYTDTYGVNRYFQWYYGTSETQLGENLDALHAQIPTQPLGVSEYGAGNAITHHTDNVLGGRVCSRDASGSTRICYQPEGYANYVHEKAYGEMVKRPYLMGTWIWNMFDFGSGNRHEGDIGQTNTKGIVTFGRDVKKDVFYFYKANWTQTPVTYITSRRYTQRAYPVTDIKIYSNASTVTLQVNGQAVGTKAAADCPLKVCEFKGVPLKAGNNSIVVNGSHGADTVTDAVSWNLADENANNFFIAAGELTTGFLSSDALLGAHRYGSDNFYVGGELPAVTGRSAIGLSGASQINGLGSTAIPETGRVWDMWREGSAFSYKLPIANGSYLVTLGFLEPTVTAAGARVFNVSANGVNQIANLDVFQASGARNTAIARKFSVTVTNGQLVLDFQGVTGKAIVSNIAVVKQ